jgi:hypothetical protein
MTPSRIASLKVAVLQHADFRYGDNKCRERATHFFSTKMAAVLRRWPEARGTSRTAMRSGSIPHIEDQLLFASEGVTTVETIEGVWVVPPLRAVRTPAETAHAVVMCVHHSSDVFPWRGSS